MELAVHRHPRPDSPLSPDSWDMCWADGKEWLDAMCRLPGVLLVPWSDTAS